MGSTRQTAGALLDRAVLTAYKYVCQILIFYTILDFGYLFTLGEPLSSQSLIRQHRLRLRQSDFAHLRMG